MSNFTRRFKKQGGASQDERLLQSLQTQAIALHQYANGSNWAYDHGRWFWLGEANGPELAEKALGIKSEKTKTLMEIYRPKTEET